MDQERVIPDQTVIIQNGRITHIGETNWPALLHILDSKYWKRVEQVA